MVGMDSVILQARRDSSGHTEHVTRDGVHWVLVLLYNTKGVPPFYPCYGMLHAMRPNAPPRHEVVSTEGT